MHLKQPRNSRFNGVRFLRCLCALLFNAFVGKIPWTVICLAPVWKTNKYVVVVSSQLLLEWCSILLLSSFTLLIYTGEAQQYQWSFGDMTPDKRTTVGSVKHTYTSVGNYVVTVKISNDFNSIVIGGNVRIRHPLEFTGISANHAEVGQPSSITLQLTNPTDIDGCTWKFNGIVDSACQKASCTHTYPEPGQYEIQVECANQVITTTQSTVITAYHPVKGNANRYF